MTFKFSAPKAPPQEKNRASNKRKQQVHSENYSTLSVLPSKKKKVEPSTTNEKSSKLRESTYKTPANFPKVYLPPPTPAAKTPVVKVTTPPRRTRGRPKQRKSVSAPTTPVRRKGRPKKVLKTK